MNVTKEARNLIPESPEENRNSFENLRLKDDDRAEQKSAVSEWLKRDSRFEYGWL